VIASFFFSSGTNAYVELTSAALSWPLMMRRAPM